MEPIELTTGDGLVLRAWQEDDAEDVFRACQDPLIQRWTMVPVPYLREHAVAYVREMSRAAWATQTSAPLGVFDARTGELLASAGLVTLDLRNQHAELGTWVAPWARGRRVAERAGRAVAHWAFEVLGLTRLVWRAEVGNHASKLSAERIGFTFDGVVRALLPAARAGSSTAGTACCCPARSATRPRRGWPGRTRRAARPHVRQSPDPAAGRARHAADRPRGDLDDLVETFRDRGDRRVDVGPAGLRSGAGPGLHPSPVPDRLAARHRRRLRARRPRRPLRRHHRPADQPGRPGDRRAGLLLGAVDPGQGVHDRGDAGDLRLRVRPARRWAGSSGARTSATSGRRRVAEKVGFVVEGVQRDSCEQRGMRLDGWVATLLGRT